MWRHPRSWGASSRDDPEGGAGSGVPRPRLVTVGLGRSGTPPARHYDLAARSSLHGSGGNAGDGSADPGRKSPRWSAERRASRRCGARRASIGVANEISRLSALRPPLDWVSAKVKDQPGRNNAPRERRRLPADAKAMAGLLTCPPKLQRRRVRCLTSW